MSIVLVIGCCIAIVLAIILFSYGRKKEKPALTTTGFVVAIVLMLAAIAVAIRGGWKWYASIQEEPKKKTYGFYDSTKE